MTRLLTILLICFFCFSCINRKAFKRKYAEANTCRNDWQYKNAVDTLHGTVLYHTNASFHCGVLASASQTIIRTNNNDTIRILWLCNTNKTFNTHEKVTIYFSQRPSFSVSPPVQTNQFDCIIRNTYFGTITSLSNSNSANGH